MRIHDLRRALRVLGIDLRRDEHRLVAERTRVEDRGDLADDAAVEQALRTLHRVVDGETGAGCDVAPWLRVEREVRLEHVHQPLVQVVERDRRTALARAQLGLRDLGYASHRAASIAWYVRIMSAPARRMLVSASSAAARSSSQPLRAAAFSIEYSPETL